MSVWPGRLARAGSGLLVLGAVGVVVGASWIAPPPSDVPVEAAVVPVPPGATTLVCPGPIVLPDSRDDVDPEFNPAPVGSVDAARFAVGGTTGAAPLQIWPLDRLAGAPVLSAEPSGVRIASVAPSGPLVGRAQPADDVAARVAGAVVSTVAAGDLRGTAAAACQHPGSEHWLVGGGTELGTTSLLIVHNPGATPAEIGLDIWGAAGRVDLGGAARYVVPSGGELSLRLSAFAPELANAVVRVTSAGGQVSAFMQVSVLDGFTPGGADLVVAGAPPAGQQVVSTLVVPASEIEGPGAGVLRLLAPGVVDAEPGAEPGGEPGGEQSAEPADDRAADTAQAERPSLPESVPARLTFLGAAGPVTLPGAEQVDLVIDEVTDVDLGGLPAGQYAVVVEAERPVVAATRIERVGTPAVAGDPAPIDLAWSPASTLGGDALLAIPAGLSTTAVVVGVPAPGEGEGAGVVSAVVRAYDEVGTEILVEDVAVPVGSTLGVPLPSGTAAFDIVPTSADAAVTDGGRLAWGVLAESVGPDGSFVSTLTPPVRDATVATVAVRHSQRLPLD